jgi:hypothetical protein
LPQAGSSPLSSCSIKEAASDPATWSGPEKKPGEGEGEGEGEDEGEGEGEGEG